LFLQAVPCKNHPKRGSLFCHDHDNNNNNWDVLESAFDIYQEAKPHMRFHTTSLNPKPPKVLNHFHVAKSSGENVLDEAEVRSTNQKIYSNLRNKEEFELNHRMISNHPSAYHLNRACYDYRLMFSIIGHMAEEDEDSLTDEHLMEVFGMFLCRKCCANIPGKGLCNKKSCHGSIWCEKHYVNHLGYNLESDAEIYLEVLEESNGDHFSTRAIVPKKKAI
jgi:hypothetical protein